MNYPIYPLVQIEQWTEKLTQVESALISHEWLRLSTTIRKYHDGKWWVGRVVKEWVIETAGMSVYITNMFHAEVYNFLMLGIPQNDCFDLHDHSLFTIDPNQISEEERLRSLQPKPISMSPLSPGELTKRYPFPSEGGSY